MVDRFFAFGFASTNYHRTARAHILILDREIKRHEVALDAKPEVKLPRFARDRVHISLTMGHGRVG
jgi:hypothetical protein